MDEDRGPEKGEIGTNHEQTFISPQGGGSEDTLKFTASAWRRSDGDPAIFKQVGPAACQWSRIQDPKMSAVHNLPVVEFDLSLSRIPQPGVPRLLSTRKLQNWLSVGPAKTQRKNTATCATD